VILERELTTLVYESEIPRKLGLKERYLSSGAYQRQGGQQWSVFVKEIISDFKRPVLKEY
jgi:hypothetical protein